MSLRDGTLGQKGLFGLLVAVAALGMLLAAADKLLRLGTANVGWTMDGLYVSPTHDDASDAGLRGGGRALRINGVEVPPFYERGHTVGPNVREEIGVSNTIVVRSPDGKVRELTLVARPWVWQDFVFTQGASDVIGLFFIFVGLTPNTAPFRELVAADQGSYITVDANMRTSVPGIFGMCSKSIPDVSITAMAPLLAKSGSPKSFAICFA